MPELPDLEVFAENLMKKTADKTICSAEIFNHSKVSGDLTSVRETLLGRRIVRITRSGKELYFHTGDGCAFSVHLMLSGRFDICPQSRIAGISFKILTIGFEDGSALAVSDYQGMARVTMNPTVPSVPDALSPEFTLGYFLNAANGSRRKNIKAFIISQDILRGIGNAYADEILWAAGISPESVTGKIPADKLEELYNAIGRVLREAVINIRRLAPDIISGEERSFLSVHNPHKKRTDEGDLIKVGRIASKTTYYTEKQTVFK